MIRPVDDVLLVTLLDCLIRRVDDIFGMTFWLIAVLLIAGVTADFMHWFSISENNVLICSCVFLCWVQFEEKTTSLNVFKCVCLCHAFHKCRTRLMHATSHSIIRMAWISCQRGTGTSRQKDVITDRHCAHIRTHNTSGAYLGASMKVLHVAVLQTYGCDGFWLQLWPKSGRFPKSGWSMAPAEILAGFSDSVGFVNKCCVTCHKRLDSYFWSTIQNRLKGTDAQIE